MKKLTNLQTITMHGGTTQIAKLPLSNKDDEVWFSEWVAYNGTSEDYEIRWRLSKFSAEKLGLK
jgi:hypothetical protein